MTRTSSSQSPSAWSCFRWGLHSYTYCYVHWWSLTPPFHPYLHPHQETQAVCFLLHYPLDFSRWALPTTLLCEVRTFLGISLDITRRSERLTRIVVASHCLQQPELQTYPLPLFDLNQAWFLFFRHLTLKLDREDSIFELAVMDFDMVC